MELLNISLAYLVLVPVFVGWLLISFVPIGIVVVSIFAIYDSYSSVKNARLEHIDEAEPILIVDDDYFSVAPLLSLLESSKVPFKYVASGISAVKELRESKFRIVFMDFCMPNLTGLDALLLADRQMLQKNRITPVIFYTDVEIERESGIDKLKNINIVDRWNKSINLKRLQARLDSLMAFEFLN